MNFLKDGATIELEMHGERVLDAALPPSIELEVADTAPGVKGDTAAGGTKPATVETGLVVNVPLFVNVGDTIRVDTRTNGYIERVRLS
jgi:elongation factor P